MSESSDEAFMFNQSTKKDEMIEKITDLWNSFKAKNLFEEFPALKEMSPGELEFLYRNLCVEYIEYQKNLPYVQSLKFYKALIINIGINDKELTCEQFDEIWDRYYKVPEFKILMDVLNKNAVYTLICKILASEEMEETDFVSKASELYMKTDVRPKFYKFMNLNFPIEMLNVNELLTGFLNML